MSATVIESFVVQRAFWPPDREIPLVKPKRRSIAALFTHRASVTEKILHSIRGGVASFYCTYPDCPRDMRMPFDSAANLANHRFAAHGIRSTNEQSIQRQQRRDKKRALEKGLAPEYIDQKLIRSEVTTLLPINLQPNTKLGQIDAGDREYVRRRLCQTALALFKELHREPAELVIAFAQIAASGLKPMGLSAKKINATGALAPAPRSTKRAVARGSSR